VSCDNIASRRDNQLPYRGFGIPNNSLNYQQDILSNATADALI